MTASNALYFDAISLLKRFNLRVSWLKYSFPGFGARYRMTEADGALTFQNWRVGTRGRHRLRRAVSD